jgi:hypothetical protein
MAKLYICMTNCVHMPASNFATVWNAQHHLHVHSMFDVYTYKIVTEKSHFFNLDNYKTWKNCNLQQFSYEVQS